MPCWECAVDRSMIQNFWPNVLIENQIRVLEADTKGTFVLMLEGTYNEKACAAVQNNFRPKQAVLKKVRCGAFANLGTPVIN